MMAFSRALSGAQKGCYREQLKSCQTFAEVREDYGLEQAQGPASPLSD